MSNMGGGGYGQRSFSGPMSGGPPGGFQGGPMGGFQGSPMPNMQQFGGGFQNRGGMMGGMRGGPIGNRGGRGGMAGPNGMMGGMGGMGMGGMGMGGGMPGQMGGMGGGMNMGQMGAGGQGMDGFNNPMAGGFNGPMMGKYFRNRGSASSRANPRGGWHTANPVVNNLVFQSGQLRRSFIASGQGGFQGPAPHFNPAFFNQNGAGDGNWNPHGAKRPRPE
jgi:hypothetical protein